MIYKEGWNHL